MSLSKANREEALKYLPDDEIDKIYDACVALFAEWADVAPRIEDYDNPNGVDSMDKLIRSTLVKLARGGIEKSLTKLSTVATWVFDPDGDKTDWKAPENIVAAVLYTRLGDSDLYLTELRDLKYRKETGDWKIVFRDDTGTAVSEVERIFPFWPHEERLGLDTFVKAFEYYQGQCKARMLA